MKSSTVLLSPELKARVLTKTKEVYSLAEKHFNRSFSIPEIRFDVKNWAGGYAYPDQNLIRYNLILLVENQDHFIEHVIPHEIAHLINHIVTPIPEGKKRLMPHGKEWKRIMGILKVPAKVKHKYSCISIEKGKRIKRRHSPFSRVDRILKSIRRLTEEERLILEIGLRDTE